MRRLISVNRSTGGREMSQIIRYRFGLHPMAETRAWLRRCKIYREISGNYLKRMLQLRAIFVHIPKTGGKTVHSVVFNTPPHENFGHADIAFYKDIFGPRRFDSFIKFAVVRNPFTRLASAFLFAKRGGFGFEPCVRLQQSLSDVTFRQFVSSILNEEYIENGPVIFRKQVSFIHCGELSVDYIIRCENLDCELDQMCRRLGVQYRRVVVNVSPESCDYMSMYTDTMKRRVQALYQKDFSSLSY